jgi:hypothetical protein
MKFLFLFSDVTTLNHFILLVESLDHDYLLVDAYDNACDKCCLLSNRRKIGRSHMQTIQTTFEFFMTLPKFKMNADCLIV